MNKQHYKIGDNLYPRVCDATLIGDWAEVSGIEASTLKPELGTERLDGLIIKGYEMKWDTTNENGERYDRDAFSQFINEYYVERKLNMPVDINHEGYRNYNSICGRVLYVETNSVGFYFVIYVPRAFEGYNELLWRLREGVIQGFSKEGYATDWEYHYKEDGTFDYELIKQIKLISVSLVSTPANGIAFEKMQEVKNGLVFVEKEIDKKPQGLSLADMFNNKNK